VAAQGVAEEVEVAAIKLVCLTCPKAIELAQHPSSDHAIAMPDSGVGALLMLKFIQIFGRRLCTLIVLLALLMVMSGRSCANVM
jgi:hypothetical protein